MKPRFHSAHRQNEETGDLRNRQIHEIMEDDYLFLLFGQVFNDRLNDSPVNGIDQPINVFSRRFFGHLGQFIGKNNRFRRFSAH